MASVSWAICVCTSLHASTPPLSFLQAGCPSCYPTSSVIALKAHSCTLFSYRHCLHSVQSRVCVVMWCSSVPALAEEQLWHSLVFCNRAEAARGRSTEQMQAVPCLQLRDTAEHSCGVAIYCPGAMLVICDINEYRKCVKEFNILLVTQLFNTLHALCNLLVVVPENLKQVCSGEELVSACLFLVIHLVSEILYMIRVCTLFLFFEKRFS